MIGSVYGARILVKARATVVSKCDLVLKALRLSVRDLSLGILLGWWVRQIREEWPSRQEGGGQADKMEREGEETGE